MTWIVALFARLSLPAWLQKAMPYLLLVGLIGALWLWLSARENADDKRNQEIGRDIERAESVAHTLDQLEKADAAEQKLDSDPVARRDNCRLHSRTPENCRP